MREDDQERNGSNVTRTLLPFGPEELGGEGQRWIQRGGFQSPLLNLLLIKHPCHTETAFNPKRHSYKNIKTPRVGELRFPN